MASFLTKARCTFVRPGDEDIDQLAWDVLQVQKWAGFGGWVGANPATITDPLPSPLPLPGAPVEVYPRAAWTGTTRVVENGHSLTDDPFGDPWPGMLVHLRNSIVEPEDFGTTYMVRSTIPGSSSLYRFNQRLSPRDNADVFDALVITERGIDVYGVAPPDADTHFATAASSAEVTMWQ